MPGRGLEPYRQRGPDIHSEARDTRILTHTSTFSYKATGLEMKGEKDRALLGVGGCLVLSFLRFTFSMAHLFLCLFAHCLTDKTA